MRAGRRRQRACAMHAHRLLCPHGACPVLHPPRPSPAHAGIDDFLHRMEIALFAYGEGVLHGLRGLPMPLNQLWTARRQAAAAGLPRRS